MTSEDSSITSSALVKHSISRKHRINSHNLLTENNLVDDSYINKTVTTTNRSSSKLPNLLTRTKSIELKRYYSQQNTSLSSKLERQSTNINSQTRLPTLYTLISDNDHKQTSELRRRQIYALNHLMRELEQEQFRQFCKLYNINTHDRENKTLVCMLKKQIRSLVITMDDRKLEKIYKDVTAPLFIHVINTFTNLHKLDFHSRCNGSNGRLLFNTLGKTLSSSTLEHLGLYFTVYVVRFIDGDHLKKNTLNYMPKLNKFTYNICSIISLTDQTYLPSNEYIQCTLSNLGTNQIIPSVDDFLKQENGQCHIYSHQYTMKYYYSIINNFLGGLFKCVQKISLFDEHPFEHDFFIRISEAFPSLKKLS